MSQVIGPSWKKIAAPAAGAALVVALILAFALGGGADPIARIDAGEAQAVLDDIAKKPIGERGPEDDLVRGHAHAKLGENEKALAAYVLAAGKGQVDERVLAFALTQLEDRKAKDAMKLLIAWPDKTVTPKLYALLDEDSWWPRHHALRVLSERGEDSDVDRVRLALLDLDKGPNCGARRYGLRQLKDIGKGDDVLAAIDKAAANAENGCMRKEIDDVKKAVSGRK